MNSNTHTKWPRIRESLLVLLVSALSTQHSALPAFAKLETWRQETSSAFAKGHRERVVISDAAGSGSGRRWDRSARSTPTRVWDLAGRADGAVFAATGDAGKVFRREAKGDAPWTVAYDATDTQALALAVLPDGRVFVGTGPTGQVVEVTDPKHPALRPDPGVSTSGTSPPTRTATCTPPPARPASSGSSRPTGNGRSCSTASTPTCSASRSGPTGRSTPAATARG